MEDKEKLEKNKKIVNTAMKIFGIFMIIFILIVACSDKKEKDELKEELKNAVYKWEYTKDKNKEFIIETQIIGVGTREHADYEIEEGTYKIKYTYEESDLPAANNRTYMIIITDSYIEDIDNYTEVMPTLIGPTEIYEYPKEIEVKKGQYIYVQHHAKSELPKGGNFYLLKKDK